MQSKTVWFALSEMRTKLKKTKAGFFLEADIIVRKQQDLSNKVSMTQCLIPVGKVEVFYIKLHMLISVTKKSTRQTLLKE